MCGIFGVISRAGSFSDTEITKFEKSLELISYRGPDDQSHKLLNDNKIFLGHRRLSIIDLSTEANQPMESDGVWIVFNGEIFNYVEIRLELIKKGYQFQTQSDTEVILKAYIEYGAEGFDRFNGMWSFLLFDTRKNIFIASRDRFSIKPLYYLKRNDFIYFASEIKQLLPFLPEKHPNPTVLKTLLSQRIQDYNLETFYKDIFKVPAKSSLIIDTLTNKEIINQYWNYTASLDVSNEADALAKFEYLFEESIKIRLRSDVQIGCLLSGGLDSTAISVVADKINNNKIQTFSIVSDDPKYSEENFIDIAVKKAGLINKKLTFNAALADQYIDKCLFHQDEPFAVASVVAQYMIFELIKKNSGIKVVLSGQGGDEVLMGYLKYFFFNIQNKLKGGEYLSMMRELLASLIKRTAIMQFDFSIAKRYSPSLQKTQKSLVNLSQDQLQNIWQVGTINERQKLDLDNFSVPALNHYEDRNSMAHSIESRTPFLDHRLVDFLVNLKSDLKYKHGWSKYLLRNSKIPMPYEIRWRRDKKGFSVPERAWLIKLEKEITDIKNYDKMFQYDVVDKSVLKSRINGFYSGSRLVDPKEIFGVYVANKWLNNNF